MQTRRIFLSGLGGLAAVHVTGCAEGTPAGARVPRHAPHDRHRPPAPLDDATPEATSQPLPEPAPPPPSPRVVELDLPRRDPAAETGSAFLARTEGLGRAAMDDAILAAIFAGNIPPYQRRLVPLVLAGPGGARAALHVTCDYLAVGSDDDFVRMPMTSAAAQRIANRVGASLPTPTIVDAIYRAAEARLPPCWIDGGPTEGTLADYALHHDKLEERRARARAPLGVLTAGHKKDIVLSSRMAEREDHVAIYGWHLAEGEVVQPLSMRHSCRYADYSHGIRLVDQQVDLDGAAHRVSDLLRDPELASILSEEGPLDLVAYPTTLPSLEETRIRRKKRR